MNNLTRRNTLQAALGLGVISATGATCTPLVSPSSWANDPSFNIGVIGKLQGDLSGKPTYSYNPGFVYGVIPNQGLAPAEFGQLLYKVEGVTKRISRLLQDGSIEERSRNWMFYCDADTGAYLKQWRNPYTQAIINVPPWRGSPSTSKLTLQGPVMDFGSGFENTSIGQAPKLDWRTLGETTWITRHAATRLTDDTGNARNEMSIDSWVCKTRDVAASELTHIPSTYAWTSHAQWQAWTEMQGRPGHVIWRVETVVMHERDELPNSLLAQLNKIVPGKIDEPMNWKV